MDVPLLIIGATPAARESQASFKRLAHAPTIRLAANRTPATLEHMPRPVATPLSASGTTPEPTIRLAANRPLQPDAGGREPDILTGHTGGHGTTIRLANSGPLQPAQG